MHLAAWVDMMAVQPKRWPPSDPGFGNGLAALDSLFWALSLAFGLGYSGMTDSN